MLFPLPLCMGYNSSVLPLEAPAPGSDSPSTESLGKVWKSKGWCPRLSRSFTDSEGPARDVEGNCDWRTGWGTMFQEVGVVLLKTMRTMWPGFASWKSLEVIGDLGDACLWSEGTQAPLLDKRQKWIIGNSFETFCWRRAKKYDKSWRKSWDIYFHFFY